MKNKFTVLISAYLMTFSSLLFAEQAAVQVLMNKDLADFGNKEGMMLTVEYAPGASSKTHKHDAHIFVYVLQGSVIMQVEGGEPVEVKAGQTFYEAPNDIHLVSKNASDKEKAKFLVFSLKGKNIPVLIPVP